MPQIEIGASALARQKGIAVAGPRYFLPLEVTKKIGPLDVDFEAGYYVAGQGPRERTLGLVAGRSLDGTAAGQPAVTNGTVQK